MRSQAAHAPETDPPFGSGTSSHIASNTLAEDALCAPTDLNINKASDNVQIGKQKKVLPPTVLSPAVF